MNLNDYIETLQKLRDEQGGDIRVVEIVPYAPAHAIRDKKNPVMETLQVKTKRESYEKIYRHSPWGTPTEDTRIKVIVI